MNDQNIYMKHHIVLANTKPLFTSNFMFFHFLPKGLNCDLLAMLCFYYLIRIELEGGNLQNLSRDILIVEGEKCYFFYIWEISYFWILFLGVVFCKLWTKEDLIDSLGVLLEKIPEFFVECLTREVVDYFSEDFCIDLFILVTLFYLQKD